MPPIDLFPDAPRLRGRSTELATLARMVASGAQRIALVGGGGTGKSVLAAALGHHTKKRFGGRVYWFRIGAWDALTLFEMLARRFGTARGPDGRISSLRAFLDADGPSLIVFDNHEDDAATARVLDALAGTATTVLITARRCLLSGVLIFPVAAPLVTRGRAPFPRVAGLTRALRWNPLALDIADAIVASGAATTRALGEYLEANGVHRVRVIRHEDDLPEVALLVSWTWARVPASSQRMLAVLAHVRGDHVDLASLARLAKARDAVASLAPLLRFRLVQEPLRGRYALHAVVRYAMAQRSSPAPDRHFEHYVSLLEREPSRLPAEQTHLFAAMDHASRQNDLGAMLRIEALLAKLDRP